MLLFLDVVSPLPEFFIIEDNKVIFQRKILKNDHEKLSDNIFQTYIEIEQNLNLSVNLKKLAMTTGPGSYTGLRVGAAFLSGLQISRNLEFCPISLVDIFKFKTNINDTGDCGIFISSAKNQNYFCTLNNNKEIEYEIISNNKVFIKNNISKIFYNVKKIEANIESIEQYKFSFIDELLLNTKRLIFKNNIFIQPLYLSTNKILN